MVLCHRPQLNTCRLYRIGNNPGLYQAGGNGTDDFDAGSLLQFDMQAWALSQPRGESGWEKLGQCNRIGIKMKRAASTGSKIPQLALELCLLAKNQSCMVGERFLGFRCGDASGAAFKKLHTCVSFDTSQALAGRSQC